MCIKFILLQNFTSRPLCIPGTMDNTYSSNSESIRFEPWQHQLFICLFFSCFFFLNFNLNYFSQDLLNLFRVSAHVRMCEQSTDSRPKVDQQSTDISAYISTDCRPMHQPICADLSVDCRPIYRSTVGQSIGRQSADISADVSADMSTEATYSTHDPLNSCHSGEW